MEEEEGSDFVIHFMVATIVDQLRRYWDKEYGLISARTTLRNNPSCACIYATVPHAIVDYI